MSELILSVSIFQQISQSQSYPSHSTNNSFMPLFIIQTIITNSKWYTMMKTIKLVFCTSYTQWSLTSSLYHLFQSRPRYRSRQQPWPRHRQHLRREWPRLDSRLCFLRFRLLWWCLDLWFLWLGLCWCRWLLLWLCCFIWRESFRISLISLVRFFLPLPKLFQVCLFICSCCHFKWSIKDLYTCELCNLICSNKASLGIILLFLWLEVEVVVIYLFRNELI